MYDVFISHASEDKEEIAIPLSTELEKLGFSVWLDAHVIQLGDSLRRKIDEGLSKSRYGIVILSQKFFEKEWTKKELDALVSRENGKEKVILPIRHKISHDEIREFSPLLADKLSVSTDNLNVVVQKIADVLKGNQLLSQNKVESIVIGISGGSCSGKTWLSRQFEQYCPKSVCIFDLDGYYMDQDCVSRLEYTHDNPMSINFDDALTDLTRLKAGREVEIPIYNFESHQQEGVRICKPASIIIVEGVFTFSREPFYRNFDFKVWVEADDVIRYQRRLKRDVRERGRDSLEVTQRYEQNVRPGYEKFIYPTRRIADITIHNNNQLNTIPEGLYALLAYCNMDRSLFKKSV